MSNETRILVIDDSEIAAELAQDAIREAGFDVRACTTLGEFTELLKQWHPHVVLADINMPSIPGSELCYWIKSSTGKTPARVVLYSDSPEEELEILAKTSDADGFVCKSRGVDAIRDVVVSVAKQRRA
jgi:two-component system OmpR family response regulator